MSATSPSIVRMVPELNIAALYSRQDKELAFWYLLRTINANRCGFVYLADAERAFHTLFHYSRSTFYEHYRLGRGKLWDCSATGRATIEIYGLQKVLTYFSIRKPSTWVEVDASMLSKVGRRPLLWNVGAYRPFGTGRENSPISRRSLAEVNKIDRRMQQRYDARAKTVRIETAVKSYDPLTHKTFRQTEMVTAAGGKKVWIRRQLGNIYTSHAVRSHKGMLRKASREAEGGKGSSLAGKAPSKALMPPRRFWSTFRDVVQAVAHHRTTGEDVYYRLKGNNAVLVQCAF